MLGKEMLSWFWLQVIMLRLPVTCRWVWWSKFLATEAMSDKELRVVWQKEEACLIGPLEGTSTLGMCMYIYILCIYILFHTTFVIEWSVGVQVIPYNTWFKRKNTNHGYSLGHFSCGSSGCTKQPSTGSIEAGNKDKEAKSEKGKVWPSTGNTATVASGVDGVSTTALVPVVGCVCSCGMVISCHHKLMRDNYAVIRWAKTVWKIRLQYFLMVLPVTPTWGWCKKRWMRGDVDQTKLVLPGWCS